MIDLSPAPIARFASPPDPTPIVLKGAESGQGPGASTSKVIFDARQDRSGSRGVIRR